MKNYLIIVEQAGNNFSAYAPDLEGCVATGKTMEEARQNMKKALEMHIQGLLEDELPIPEPSTKSFYEEVS